VTGPRASDGLRAVLLPVSALLASVVLLVLGNGLQGTLLGVRAGFEGMGATTVGVIMSAYFFGYLFGSLHSPAMVARVGHIRTFSALASITSAVALAHAIAPTAAVWTVLRAAHGFCYAGLVLVIESWLNGSTTRRFRGRVLAVYGTAVSASWALSQALLILAPAAEFVLFAAVSILMSLALVPISLARVSTPSVVETPRMGIAHLYRTSPSGVVGVAAVGFCLSAFTGLAPVSGQQSGWTEGRIALFMTAWLLGALLMQWTLGSLSDRVDRRWVIAGASLASAGWALALGLGPHLGTPVGAGAPVAATVALVFAYGGFSLPVYSICVAHANDLIAEHELLPAASALLLVFGAGSIAGPLAAGAATRAFGPPGLFVLLGAVHVLAAAFVLQRMPRRARVPAEEKEPFVPVPRTTPVILRLDERGGD
jgi:MFS family permease